MARAARDFIARQPKETAYVILYLQLSFSKFRHVPATWDEL
jgi:hypothetical protein